MSAAALLWDATPELDADPVLVIASPGLALEAHLPLIRRLRKDGFDVHVYQPGCGDNQAAIVEGSRLAIHALGPETVVVAHGVGAALALSDVEARGWVLLAPVLDVWPVALTVELAATPVSALPHTWRGLDVKRVLLGEIAMGCISPTLAAELQGWVQDGPPGHAPVGAPVRIAVSAGDNLATLEAVVPASREFSERQLVRLGKGSFASKDYDHGEMLSGHGAVRWASRMVRRLRGGR